VVLNDLLGIKKNISGVAGWIMQPMLLYLCCDCASWCYCHLENSGLL